MPKLEDGYQTLIDIAGATLYEREVQPPGIDAGGEIDTTVMDNTVWRTKAPKSLKSMTEHTFEAAYDPLAYTTIAGVIGTNTLITITFPDTSTLAFWGFLDKFIPNPHVEGEMPTASCTVVPTLVNGSGGLETAPVFTPAA